MPIFTPGNKSRAFSHSFNLFGNYQFPVAGSQKKLRELGSNPWPSYHVTAAPFQILGVFNDSKLWGRESSQMPLETASRENQLKQKILGSPPGPGWLLGIIIAAEILVLVKLSWLCTNNRGRGVQSPPEAGFCFYHFIVSQMKNIYPYLSILGRKKPKRL